MPGIEASSMRPAAKSGSRRGLCPRFPVRARKAGGPAPLPGLSVVVPGGSGPHLRADASFSRETESAQASLPRCGLGSPSCQTTRAVQRSIMLPGGILPASLAYEALQAELGDRVHAVAKELEVYRDPLPPAGFTLDVEVAGILRCAEEVGFDRFHLVGYSGRRGIEPCVCGDASRSPQEPGAARAGLDRERGPQPR